MKRNLLTSLNTKSGKNEAFQNVLVTWHLCFHYPMTRHKNWTWHIVVTSVYTIVDSELCRTSRSLVNVLATFPSSATYLSIFLSLLGPWYIQTRSMPGLHLRSISVRHWWIREAGHITRVADDFTTDLPTRKQNISIIKTGCTTKVCHLSLLTLTWPNLYRQPLLRDTTCLKRPQ